jgi:nucleotide-binding universal stress UspA family protein
MIWHQRKRKEFYWIAFQAFAQDAEEGLIVLAFVEDGLPSISTMESMVDRTGFISTLLLGHGSTRWNGLFRSSCSKSIPDRPP